MRLRDACVAIALIVVFASSGYSQEVQTTPPPPEAPRFGVEVEVFGNVMADFSARVSAYTDLRNELNKGLPPLTVDDPAHVQKAVQALAAKIRVARARAKRGDIFTPAIARAFQKALLQVDDSTWVAIVDDNPGEFSKPINASYPEDKPFSTVPPNILKILPRLPDDMEYHFLGRHLILLDTRASVIVDWIPFAIGCADSDDKTSCHR
jgi:hypothetical protein